MSLSPEVIDALVASGLSVEQFAAIVKADAIASERMRREDDQAERRRGVRPEVFEELTAEERRRAAGRERQRRYQDKRRQTASENNGSDVSDDASDGADVISNGSDAPPETKVSPTPPSKTQTPTPFTPYGGVSPTPEAGLAQRQGDLLGGQGASDGEAWKAEAAADVEFNEFWQAATQTMRTRSSQKSTWKAWKGEKRRHLPAKLVAAIRRYVAEDPDVKADRGQPGLHRWLTDQKFEPWIQAEAPSAVLAGPVDCSDWSDDRWSATINDWRRTGRWPQGIGPPPDQPDTNAPERFRHPQRRTAA